MLRHVVHQSTGVRHGGGVVGVEIIDDLVLQAFGYERLDTDSVFPNSANQPGPVSKLRRAGSYCRTPEYEDAPLQDQHVQTGAECICVETSRRVVRPKFGFTNRCSVNESQTYLTGIGI